MSMEGAAAIGTYLEWWRSSQWLGDRGGMQGPRNTDRRTGFLCDEQEEVDLFLQQLRLVEVNNTRI